MEILQKVKKTLIKSFLVANRYFIRKYYGGIGHILMFHSVIPEMGTLRIGNDSLEVTPEHLEKIIRYFQKNDYEVITMNELVERLKGDKSSSKKFVVFTFDDGYLDNLVHALPVFEKLNAPFTVYVTTNFPDKKALVWWYPLEEILRRNNKVELSFENEVHVFNTSSPTLKLEAFIKMRDLIQSQKKEKVRPFLDAIFRPYNIDVKSASDALSMNWEQLKVLASSPLVTIGAHTVNHYRLNTLTAEKVKQEFIEAKELLETQLGRRVEHMSYPFGTRNDVGMREFEIARECGYLTATTTRFGNIFREHNSHLFSLPRINIDMNVNENDLQKFLNGETQFLSHRGKRIITE